MVMQLCCATKVQPERVVTVLVVGAAGAGKSTLLKLLGFAGVFFPSGRAAHPRSS